MHVKIITLLFALSADIGVMAGEKTNLEEGEAYFQKKDYAKAVIYLDQALQNSEQEKWYSEGLCKLARCYLEIAKDTKQSEKIQNDHFEKAELILQKIKDIDNSESLQFALARTYIIQGTQLKNPEALEKGKTLIHSLKDGDYSKLLLAQASPSYKDKKELYHEITEITNASSRWYAIGWYLRGLNELNEGGENLAAAATAFQNAFGLLYPNEIQLAALCLKYKAEAFADQLSKEGNMKALSELNLLIQLNHGELLAVLDDPGEIYYQRGLIAARLFQEGAGQPFGDLAEKSLLEGLNNFSKGKYVPETMKTLGILYFQQQRLQEAFDVFEKLVKTYSTSNEAAEALLWISTCVNCESGKTYLKKLYTDYPLSIFADEAYFRYYSFDEYLKGTDDALEHLNLLHDKFPNSNYQIVTHHLLGHYSKKKNDLETAADLFEKSEIAYTTLLQGKNEDNYFKEIANQSAIERALILLELERMDESEIILKRLILSLQNSDSVSPLLEKAAYHLVKIYIKEQQDDAAEKLITMMLKMYEKSKMNDGYYVSRLWYERGMIAMRENSPRQALNYLRHAELAGKGDVLDKGQLLDLWIQQSLCHLELGEMDNSMLILSRVANYNATSSLRVKAMYLRAEIYERQGRHELAKKQLQATSTKGGEWALKAKQKLEKDYVHQQHSG